VLGWALPKPYAGTAINHLAVRSENDANSFQRRQGRLTGSPRINDQVSGVAKIDAPAMHEVPLHWRFREAVGNILAAMNLCSCEAAR